MQIIVQLPMALIQKQVDLLQDRDGPLWILGKNTISDKGKYTNDKNYDTYIRGAAYQFPVAVAA